jgi:hypothetical protein
MTDWKWCENCGYHGDFKIIEGHAMVFCRDRQKYMYRRSECKEYSRFSR